MASATRCVVHLEDLFHHLLALPLGLVFGNRDPYILPRGAEEELEEVLRVEPPDSVEGIISAMSG